jgi:hypothetical protein
VGNDGKHVLETARDKPDADSLIKKRNLYKLIPHSPLFLSFNYKLKSTISIDNIYFNIVVINSSINFCLMNSTDRSYIVITYINTKVINLYIEKLSSINLSMDLSYNLYIHIYVLHQNFELFEPGNLFDEAMAGTVSIRDLVASYAHILMA